MVKVVRSVGLATVIAAASVGLISAGSLTCNPTTDTPMNGSLAKECNPITGTDVDLECSPPVTYHDDQVCQPSSSNGSTTGRHLRRLEDASNSDIQDLETYFSESLKLDFTTLKEQYASASAPSTPWPGSYWPTYQDSINVIWKSGEASASEKYANAYGLDPTDFKNKVSANNGIDSRSKSTTCTADTDCTPRNDGSVCAKRKYVSTGYCIPTWYGICHAWSPAALLEEEPQCDVVKNNQTFHVLDIKALVTDIYDGSSISTIFTGARFNGPDTPVNVDAYGRYQSDSRRDMGAGFFHIAIANILGKHKQSFVLDVTAGAQVWNQPVRSYNVQTMELVDADQASQKYFSVTPYPFNDEMVYLAYVKTTVSWVVEAYADGPLVSSGQVDKYTVSDDYQYLLELDANYAVIGGEWVEGSKTDHPDFLWFPTAKPDASTVTSTGLSYADVKELLEMSVSCSASEAASGSTSESASSSDSTSASAGTSESTSTSASAGASESTSTGAPGSTYESTSASAPTSTSARASASGSAGASTSGSSAIPSASASTSASANTSASASASSSTSTSTSGSTSSGSVGSEASTSGSGANENASVGSSTTSGEGSNEARSSSEGGAVTVTPTYTSSSGSAGTTDATETYSSRSTTGSTEEETGADPPSGKDALILTPSITTPSSTSGEESTASTEAPIDVGYYTPPPTTDGQDLADVIDITIQPTDSSSSFVQETTATTPTQTSVHKSC